MTRNVKSDLCIPVPGIEDSKHGDIANYINPNRPQSNKIQQGEVKKMR